MLIGKGSFRGIPDHVLEGTFTLTRQSDGSILFETSDTFMFDGSPEPDWGLNKGVPASNSEPGLEAQMEATRFGNMPTGPLTERIPVTGKQTGTIPAGFDLDTVDTIVLWCFRFPTRLGVGPIERV
ncbi:MAG: hypothetical protein AAF318_12470 [Pseudomonadota bacterium]